MLRPTILAFDESAPGCEDDDMLGLLNLVLDDSAPGCEDDDILGLSTVAFDESVPGFEDWDLIQEVFILARLAKERESSGLDPGAVFLIGSGIAAVWGLPRSAFGRVNLSVGLPLIVVDWKRLVREGCIDSDKEAMLLLYASPESKTAVGAIEVDSTLGTANPLNVVSETSRTTWLSW